MKDLIGTSLLIFTTLLCAVTALSAFARPTAFANLLGLQIANAGGMNEIRSQYACFFLTVGIAALAALTGNVPRPTIYVLTLVVFGGLFLGRAASLVINGGFGGFTPTIRALYVVDVTGTMLSVAALWQYRNA